MLANGVTSPVAGLKPVLRVTIAEPYRVHRPVSRVSFSLKHLSSMQCVPKLAQPNDDATQILHNAGVDAVPRTHIKFDFDLERRLLAEDGGGGSSSNPCAPTFASAAKSASLGSCQQHSWCHHNCCLAMRDMSKT